MGSRQPSSPKVSPPRSTIRFRCTARSRTGAFQWPKGIEAIAVGYMHAYLDGATQDRIIEAVRRALAR